MHHLYETKKYIVSRHLSLFVIITLLFSCNKIMDSSASTSESTVEKWTDKEIQLANNACECAVDVIPLAEKKENHDRGIERMTDEETEVFLQELQAEVTKMESCFNALMVSDKDFQQDGYQRRIEEVIIEKCPELGMLIQDVRNKEE